MFHNKRDALYKHQESSADQQACSRTTEEGTGQKRRQRSSLLLRGTEFMQFLAALSILLQDDLKNRIHCTRTIWRIGWIHPFSSNHPGEKKLVWQEIESILSPEQQRQILPSLLYLSFSYEQDSKHEVSLDPSKYTETSSLTSEKNKLSWSEKDELKSTIFL